MDIIEVYRRIAGFVRRRWWILLISLIIGGAVGFLNTMMKGPSYRLSMIVSSRFIEKEDLYAGLLPLLPLLQASDDMESEVLADFFNAEGKTYASVTNLKVDTSSMQHAIVMYFSLGDTATVNELRSSVRKFFENKDQYHKQLESALKMNKAFLEVLNQEIQELNTYQEKVLSGELGSKITQSGLSTAGSHKELVELYKKQAEIASSLEIKKPVCVSADQRIIENPVHTIRIAVFWAVLFAVLLLILLLIIELDRASRKK